MPFDGGLFILPHSRRERELREKEREEQEVLRQRSLVVMMR